MYVCLAHCQRKILTAAVARPQRHPTPHARPLFWWRVLKKDFKMPLEVIVHTSIDIHRQQQQEQISPSSSSSSMCLAF